MELWIRSQDKTILISVDNICAVKNRKVFIPNRVNGRATLGKYKTKKRTLEVLDEIENLLKGKIDDKHINKFDIYNDINTKIYEMPKE